MFKSLRIALFGFTLGTTQLLMPISSVQAGPFWDWLVGNPVYQSPPVTVVTPAGVPTTYAPASVPAVPTAAMAAPAMGVTTNYPPANYPPAAATAAPAYGYAAAPTPVRAYYPGTAAAMPSYAPVQPVTSYYVPANAMNYAPNQPLVTAYYPSAPMSVSQSYPATPAYVSAPIAPVPAYVMQPVQPMVPAQPVVVGYAPSYRTTWFRVPVTYYRPVTVYQGVPVQPTTVMQPCNANAWQAQRVPTWNPFRGSTPVTVPYGTVVTPAPAFAGAPAAGTYAPPAGMPAASVPPTYAPSTSMPYTAEPPAYAPPAGTSTVPGGSVPDYSIPPQPPAGLGPVPADQAPSLPSGGVPSTTIPNSAAIAPPAASGGTASANGVVPNAASSIYQVKPIPVPENQEQRQPDRGLAPPLLNARDRTAAQTSTRAAPVSQAGWSTPVESVRAEPSSAKPATKRPLWDDNGWRSAPGW